MLNEKKLFTVQNADKLKPGSLVVVADNLHELKNKLFEYKQHVKIIEEINDETFNHRFKVRLDNYCHNYAIAYLIEEKVLKWTDLKLGDAICKKGCSTKYMVIGIDTCPKDSHHICVPTLSWIKDCDLAKEWEMA